MQKMYCVKPNLQFVLCRRMEGVPNRTCQANGQWNNPIPVCIIVECPRPFIVNGSPSTFLREFGTTVTFTCRSRHRLEGQRSQYKKLEMLTVYLKRFNMAFL
jgi:hypothetical protein